MVTSKKTTKKTSSTKKKSNILLSTKNVNLWYGEKQALFDINLEYADSGVTALIGPSGSGKSTYLRTINRMHELSNDIKVRGEFLYNGKNIYSSNYDTVVLRKQIGMVFQQPNPFPFSIYENVAFGLKLSDKPDKKVIDERVEIALRQAGVWDEVKDNLQKNASALSGGQQQRVSIARALATQPDILLLDEPTSALDPISSSVVEESIIDLRDQYTIIIVTHNMQQASRLSNHVAFMMDGHLIEYNTTKKIFLDPDKKETMDYVSGRFG